MAKQSLEEYKDVSEVVNPSPKAKIHDVVVYACVLPAFARFSLNTLLLSYSVTFSLLRSALF